MHKSALAIGRLFFQTYWQEGFSRILDIGSYDVNGTLRRVQPAGASYLGVDMSAGPGVDLVLEDPHRLPLEDASFDVVVSTSCMEHDPLFWLTFVEMLRVVRPGGMVYVNAPSNGPHHGYPYDHWRFYPDAGLALVEWSRHVGRPVQLIESFIGARDDDVWADSVMVFGRLPLASALPERLICEQMPGTTNIRRGDCASLEQYVADTEDLRDLREATERCRALEAELARSQARVRELEARPDDVVRPAPSAITAESDSADAFRTAFPAPFLETYQAGVLAYTYRGLPCAKSPIDLALYARVIWALKPACVIEIGSQAGGSALWFADLLRSYGLRAPVYSIDLEPPQGLEVPGVTFLQGDANQLAAVFAEHGLHEAPRPWLISEDSAHTAETCAAALAQLSNLMRAGDLLVMEDGVLDDLGLSDRYDGGPNRALRAFLSRHPDVFSVDRELCDLFGRNATYAPNAWLWKT